MAIGEATLDVPADKVNAYDHEVVVISDHTTLVDVLVGRKWLVHLKLTIVRKTSIW